MPKANGAFIPTYFRENLETGQIEGAFAREDFEAISQGFGCAACFADFRGVYLEVCPTCGHRRGPNDVVDEWYTSFGFKA